MVVLEHLTINCLYVFFIFTMPPSFLTTELWCFNGITYSKNSLGGLHLEVMLSLLSPQTVGFLKQLQIRMAEIVLLCRTEVLSEKKKNKVLILCSQLEQLKFNWKQWIKGKSTWKVDLDSDYEATYFTLGLLSVLFLELLLVLLLIPESSAEILQLLLVLSIASWKHLCCKHIFFKLTECHTHLRFRGWCSLYSNLKFTARKEVKVLWTVHTLHDTYSGRAFVTHLSLSLSISIFSLPFVWWL